MMEVTVFSFLTSLLCFNLFYLFLSTINRTRFLMRSGLSLVMASLALCLVRVVFSFEFPFAIVLSSKKILPALVAIGKIGLFKAFGWRITISVVVVAIWIIVSMVLLLRLAYTHVKHNKSLNSITSIPNADANRIMSDIVSRTKPRQKYRLICNEAIAVPVISGFFIPTICFPAQSFSDVDLYNVLSHEWNHFLYKDAWVKLLFYVIRAVLWWNPLLYMLCEDLNQMLEIRCDIRSTRGFNEVEKIKYLDSILSVAKQNETSGKRMPANSVAFVGNNSSGSIKQRFEIVLGYERRPSRIQNTIICCAVALTLLLSYGFIVQSSFEPPDDKAVVSQYAITSESSYVTINPDGTYELYVDGIFMGAISGDAIQVEPFSTLPQLDKPD